MNKNWFVITAMVLALANVSNADAFKAQLPNPCLSVSAADNNTNETITITNISGTVSACATQQAVNLNNAVLSFTSNEAPSNLQVWGFNGLEWPTNQSLTGSDNNYQFTFEFSDSSNSTSNSTSLAAGQSTQVIFAAPDNSMQLSSLAIYTGTPVSSVGQIELVNTTNTALPSSTDINISGDNYSADVLGSSWQGASPYVLSYVPAGSQYKISATYINGGQTYSIPVSPDTVTVTAGQTSSVNVNYQPLPPSQMTFTVTTLKPADPYIQNDFKLNITDTTSQQSDSIVMTWGQPVVYNLNRGDSYQFSINPVVGNGNIYNFALTYPTLVANEATYNNDITLATPTPASTGVVAVDVSGLPNGQSADLDFTNSSQQTEDYPGLQNGDSNIDLPVGQYTDIANTLVVNDTSYQPTVTPSEETVQAGNDNPAVAVDYVRQVPFRPYVDMGLETGSSTPLTDIQAYSKQSGINQFTLAFITSTASNVCNPAWAGSSGLLVDNSQIQAQLAAARQAGISYVISFGGYNGDSNIPGTGITDLSTTCDASDLVAAYEGIIKAYQPIGLDFDIESDLEKDPSNNADVVKMMQALTQVSKDFPNVAISFTVPVTISGLDVDGQRVIQNAYNEASQNGWTFSVNAMAMDYEPYSQLPQPIPNNYMAQYAENAVTSPADSVEQTIGILPMLQNLYPNATTAELYNRIMITPMIGLNDPPTANSSDILVFTLDDAAALRQFAQQNQLGGLAVWSLNRDHPCVAPYANSNLCSGMQTVDSAPYLQTIQQSAFQFTQALQ